MKRFFRFEEGAECFCVDFGNPNKKGDFAIMQKYKNVRGKIYVGDVYYLGLASFWDFQKIKDFLIGVTA